MADIRLVWNPASAIADIRIIDGQVETGQDLETAVLISLFTDHVVDTATCCRTRVTMIPADGGPIPMRRRT